MSVSFQEVIDVLKEKQVRITETRKAVITYLMNSHDHPSAEMIYQDLLPEYPKMSLATVYNNLRLLLDTGFVTELKRSNDTTIYYDFMGHDHINLICQQCGSIADIDMDHPSVSTAVEEQTGYRIQKEVLTLYGICPSCQQKEKARN